MVFVTGAWVVAGATIATLVACKSGDYDGSYAGSIDGGGSVDGGSTSSLVPPGQPVSVTSSDGVLSVSFGADTFATAATITITSAGEQAVEGLVVPIYVIAADKEPTKFFQVTFSGEGNPTGGMNDRAIAPAMLDGGTFKPLAIVGNANVGGGASSAYWGLTKTLGTFSLAYVHGLQTSSFAESATTCTAQCGSPSNGSQVSGSPSGCFCPTGPNLACFLEHCPDLEAPAARCSAIAAANNKGSVQCGSFNCQTGGGGGSQCFGACGNGGGGGPNNYSACCVLGGGGSCDVGTCTGFAARCTKNTACPVDTQCCVFASESYCAKDCPAAQRACATNADCTDAGADAGTCQGGKCPMGLCGAPPERCR